MLHYQIANSVCLTYVYSNLIIYNVFAFETIEDNFLVSSDENEWIEHVTMASSTGKIE